MIYCIDTSAWLDGWARDYPPDVFPSLWDKLAECVDTPKIPDVCDMRNLRCITFLDMLRELGWKF